jgi:hypothetical protein
LPLRVVVVSDTHGYEWSLGTDPSLTPWDPMVQLQGGAQTASDKPSEWLPLAPAAPVPLPGGDVLLHLGDFAIDGPAKPRIAALAKFDEWLAMQPHAVKIVLRGNHDPWDVTFPRSKASYITKPTCMLVGGWRLALVPFNARPVRLTIPPGELLATHVPPKAHLDLTYSGERAGSSALRGAVERRPGAPPVLWVCGHIHEARGAERVRFGKPGCGETVVINAANANSGRASRLVTGPVIFEMRDAVSEVGGARAVGGLAEAEVAREVEGAGDESAGEAELAEETKETAGAVPTLDAEAAEAETVQPAVSVGAGTIALGSTLQPFASRRSRQRRRGRAVEGRRAVAVPALDEVSVVRPREMLLAVDLGLRSGLCLLSADGRLLRYEQRVFRDEAELVGEAPRILAQWEADANAAAPEGERWAVTHLAIEGGDPPLWEAWRNAAAGGTRVLSVTAGEWRTHLLLPKERRSGADAKAAARLIARQVSTDSIGRKGKKGTRPRTRTHPPVSSHVDLFQFVRPSPLPSGGV